MSMSQRSVIQEANNSHSSRSVHPMPSPMWPGEKRPLVLTFSDPRRHLGDNNDLELLHHFATFTSLDVGPPELHVVNENTTLSLALEVRY
jgi:hypothetical protein